MIQNEPLITYSDKINGTKPNSTGVVSDANMNEIKNGILALQNEAKKQGFEKFSGNNLATYTIPAQSFVLNIIAFNDGSINIVAGDFSDSGVSDNNNGLSLLPMRYFAEQTILNITGLGEILATIFILKSYK